MPAPKYLQPVANTFASRAGLKPRKNNLHRPSRGRDANLDRDMRHSIE
jgi:hypothetical protein